MAAHPTLPSAPVTPWWAQRWPWLLMLGPFLVVIAAVYSGWLAFTREDALVEDNYYLQGQAINSDLRRDSAASALGVAVALRYDAVTGMLAGRIDQTAPAAPQQLALHMQHASAPDKDLTLTLQTAPDGTFSVALPLLERTRWQVKVEDAQRRWRLAGSWSWPSQREVLLRADPPH